MTTRDICRQLATVILLAALLMTKAQAGDSSFNITNQGFTAYLIDGQANPTLVLERGATYTFEINAPGHPFWIKTQPGTGTANPFNEGVIGNGSENGSVTCTVPLNAPNQLFYNCQFHVPMTGTIHVVTTIIFNDDFESQ